MDEEHGLTGATVGIGEVDVIDREAVHASDSKLDVRARGAVSAFPHVETFFPWIFVRSQHLPSHVHAGVLW